MRYSTLGWATVLICLLHTSVAVAQGAETHERLREVLRSTQPMLRTTLFDKQLDSVHYKSYEDENWIVDFKESYSFTPEGLLTEMTTYELNDEETQWLLSERFTFNYTAQMWLETIAFEAWDASSETWMKEGELTNSHDKDGNVTEIVYTFIDESTKEEIFESKTTYTYNDDGLLTSYVDAEYEDKAWVNSDKEEYSYTPEGGLLETLASTYDVDESAWTLVTKAVHTLNKDYQVTSSLVYEWLEDIEDWEEFYIDSYTYDDNGNPISESSAYSKEDDKWLYTNRFTYSYDTEVAIEHVMVPPLDFFLQTYSDQITNMYTGYLGESFNDGEWGEDSKTEMFYSDAPSSIRPETAFNELANIRLLGQQLTLNSLEHELEYRLTLVDGKTISQGNLSVETPIALQLPQTGIYVIQVYGQDVASSYKVLAL